MVVFGFIFFYFIYYVFQLLYWLEQEGKFFIGIFVRYFLIFGVFSQYVIVYVYGLIVEYGIL